jgi:RimJ/RimL family protein N-acetyltransferase
MMKISELGTPVDDTPRPLPKKIAHIGRSVRLEPLSYEHVDSLWTAAEQAEASWTYLRYGSFPSKDALAAHILDLAGRDDQPFFAVLPASSGVAEGWLSLCDIYPKDAAIEIGSIWFSPRLQGSRASTESVFLLMRHAFDDLGYRRLVWRCHAQNAPSVRLLFVTAFCPRASGVRGRSSKGGSAMSLGILCLPTSGLLTRRRFCAGLKMPILIRMVEHACPFPRSETRFDRLQSA